MKRTPKQAGFSAAIALAVVFVVAGLGFAAWRISQASNKKTASNSPVQTPSEQKQTKSSDPSEGGMYLVIEQWDVRFLLPKDLRGSIVYRQDPEQDNAIVIDSEKFPEGSECISFGLARTLEEQKNPEDPQGFNSSSFTKIDRFYFSRVTGVIACSDDPQVQEEAASIQRSLYEAVTSLESL